MNSIVSNIIELIGKNITPVAFLLTFFNQNNQNIAINQKTDVLSQTQKISPTPMTTYTPIPTITTSTTPMSSSPTPTYTLTPAHSPSPTPIYVTSGDLDFWFTKYANEFSVDRNKLWKIAVCESNLKPRAVNGLYGGLYQFSPSAWRTIRNQMNMNPELELRFNPEESIKTAAFKISAHGTGAWPNCGK